MAVKAASSASLPGLHSRRLPAKLMLPKWDASNPGRPWPMDLRALRPFTAFQIAAGSQMATLTLATQSAWESVKGPIR